jgi:hypothetical protein
MPQELRGWSQAASRSCPDAQSTGRLLGSAKAAATGAPSSPRGAFDFAAKVGLHNLFRSPQFANDVFSRAMNRENRAPLQPLGLARRRRLEGLAMPAEPDFDDAVAA